MTTTINSLNKNMISCPVLLDERLKHWRETHKRNEIKSIVNTKNSDYIVELVINYK